MFCLSTPARARFSCGGINITKDLRINERIRAREVRLIDEAGGQVGVVPTREALQIAQQRNLDLVEVAPTAVPPVCRLLDYGKYKYEQTKKERESKKNQKSSMLKEVRLRPKIDDHDLLVKARTAQRFLQEGDKVKVTVVFRGRELAHMDIGRALLDRIVEDLREVATPERPPTMEGKSMMVMLSPSSAKA